MTIPTDYQFASTRFKDIECSVCFEEYLPASQIYLLACQHIFHPECLQGQKLCPLCRSMIEPIKLEPEVGYGFFNYLHELILKQEHKEEWTPHDIHHLIFNLKDAFFAERRWNHYAHILNFTDLCKITNKLLPLNDHDQKICETFYQEILRHRDYQELIRHLQKKFYFFHSDELSIPFSRHFYLFTLNAVDRAAIHAIEAAQPTQPGGSFFGLITRMIRIASCIPEPDQPPAEAFVHD